MFEKGTRILNNRWYTFDFQYNINTWNMATNIWIAKYLLLFARNFYETSISCLITNISPKFCSGTSSYLLDIFRPFVENGLMRKYHLMVALRLKPHHTTWKDEKRFLCLNVEWPILNHWKGWPETKSHGVPENERKTKNKTCYFLECDSECSVEPL